MLHTLEKYSKEVSIRNSASKTKKLGVQIVKKIKGVSLHFGYIPGTKNPSDYASKEIKDPLAAVDRALWRQGPSEFRNTEWLKKNTYGSITKNTELYVPTVKEEISKEEVECNKIAAVAEVKEDKDDNEAQEHQPA